MRQTNSELMIEVVERAEWIESKMRDAILDEPVTDADHLSCIVEAQGRILAARDLGATKWMKADAGLILHSLAALIAG